jgi:hypothetical protein
MRSLMSRRPSPAMVVALVALMVALGGTSYAAFAVPSNSVGTKQLKNGAVSTPKIHNRAVTKTKLNLAGVTAPNATHLGGHPASVYLTRFLAVRGNGTVDPTASTTTAQVTNPSQGTFCISGLTPDPRAVVISGTRGDDVPTTFYAWTNPGGFCPGGQIAAVTHGPSDYENEPFTLAIR